jgi:hypothetical protein
MPWCDCSTTDTFLALLSGIGCKNFTLQPVALHPLGTLFLRLGSRRMRRLIAACLCLSGCLVQEREVLDGQYGVTSYARLRGIAGTRRDNEDVAIKTCPDGYILFDEQLGQNPDGHFRRWVFACIDAGQDPVPWITRDNEGDAAEAPVIPELAPPPPVVP